MLRMQVLGKRRRDRPKRRYVDELNEDTNVAGWCNCERCEWQVKLEKQSAVTTFKSG